MKKFLGRRNTMMAVTLLDVVLYGGIVIVGLAGVLAMGMGVVAGK